VYCIVPKRTTRAWVYTSIRTIRLLLIWVHHILPDLCWMAKAVPPLHAACASASTLTVADVVELVAQGHDVNGVDEVYTRPRPTGRIRAYTELMHAQDGRTPLHVAARNDKLEIAQYLLSKGASVDTKMPVRCISWFSTQTAGAYLLTDSTYAARIHSTPLCSAARAVGARAVSCGARRRRGRGHGGEQESGRRGRGSISEDIILVYSTVSRWPTLRPSAVSWTWSSTSWRKASICTRPWWYVRRGDLSVSSPLFDWRHAQYSAACRSSTLRRARAISRSCSTLSNTKPT
jgi:hypothetical protein